MSMPTLNGKPLDLNRYRAFHRVRIARTLQALRDSGARRVIELGGHPWAFTAELLRAPDLALAATVSAEEVSPWPDAFPPTRREYRMALEDGGTHVFPNYSANLERSLFDVGEPADAVVACEIVEHLLRAPHVMMLNINRWLPPGGKLLITTPNGAQFSNFLRVKSHSPGYRAQIYERHHHVYTLDALVDLVDCCGFTMTRAEYWDPYPRTGLPRLYAPLAALPLRYLHAKFRHTLFVLAEKRENLSELVRKPRVLVGGGWEHLREAPVPPR